MELEHPDPDVEVVLVIRDGEDREHRNLDVYVREEMTRRHLGAELKLIAEGFMYGDHNFERVEGPEKEE